MKIAEVFAEDEVDLSKIEIQYGVIYSDDADPDILAGPPEEQKDLWRQTEDDDESDYGVDGWHHKKWCACLTQEQFDEFISHVCISAQSVETMGSIGAPIPDGGIDIGCSPAICFENADSDGVRNAYVTPYVMNDEFEKPYDDADWETLRDFLVEKYR